MVMVDTSNTFSFSRNPKSTLNNIPKKFLQIKIFQENKIGRLKNKNILFLQGPMGNFFKKLDKNFRQKGANTYKIGFNKGDEFFSYSDNYIPFREDSETWGKFIENFLLKHQIDKVFLFGDCRYYQRIARNIAYIYDIDVFVFEEGYLRPHYITLEKFGVNGFSNLPRNSYFYQALSKQKMMNPIHSHPSKTKMILSATLYYALSNLFSYKYPYYKHHREFSARKEFYHGIRGVYRKILYRFTQKAYLGHISGELSKKYYFIPLQTYNDFQVLEHSNYKSIESFIMEILESFSHYAPKDTFLVFKHHPVDRGRKNYSDFIYKQASLLGIKKRVHAFHDVHLPTCLKNAKATITINSTVGLSSVEYGIPTLTLGDAVYNIRGLTNPDIVLNNFWSKYRKPKKELFLKYKTYLVRKTQLNGSFYGMVPDELR